MTLTTAMKDLSRRLHALHDELVVLPTFIREDKPADTVFADMYGGTADTLLGWLTEARMAADGAQQAIEMENGRRHAYRQLATCQERVNRLQFGYFDEQGNQLQEGLFDLVSYERLRQFVRFGNQQGGEWQDWTRTVKTSLEHSLEPLRQVNEALLHTWQEIAEQAGAASVSMVATNIGQQITSPESKETALASIP